VWLWQIINGWLAMVVDSYTDCAVASTFLVSKLMKETDGYDFNKVARWMSPYILDRRVILFPVHLHLHWILIAAYPSDAKILYMDSFRNAGAIEAMGVAQ
jgi:Ulp1 family protease